MSLPFPWTIHEAEVALYPARKDGMPLSGPGGVRQTLPFLEHRVTLSVERTINPGSSQAFNYTGATMPEDGGWSLSVDFPEGAWSDELDRTLARLEPNGFYCLAVRFEDVENSGNWTLWRFFYVTLERDSTSENSQVMQRSLSLRAGWRQEQVGIGPLPALRPEPLGEVDWICGPLRVTGMLYDSATGAWTSTIHNAVSADPDAPPYVAVGTSNYTPFVSFYAPVAENSYGEGLLGDPALAGTPINIGWRHLLAFSISAQDMLLAASGFALQMNGTAEPLMARSQARMMDEPVIVFRYLRRIYCTISHGVIAIPRISNSPAPATHEPDFRIGRLRMLPFGSFFPIT